MSLEQSIVLFNKRLCVHHLDGNGEESDIPNNDINNLTTLCQRCHGKLHRCLQFIEHWGDLVIQDESKWRFPKIRELVNSEVNRQTNISEAKRIVANKLNVSYWTIDGYYYMKKEDYPLSKFNKVPKR